MEVVYACQRNGPKFSPSFSFGCKVNGTDLTQSVLDTIGGGYTVTVTQGSTVVITGSVTDYTTTTSTPISEVDLSTSVDVTSSSTMTDISTFTATVDKTQTITNAIPVTATSTTHTTTTTTTPVTLTLATTTTTKISVGTESVPVLLVSIPKSTSKKRQSNRVDDTQICSAFSIGCTSQCARVYSTPKHVICQSTPPLMYQLTCFCKNHKVETQHALAAAMDQIHVATVSTVSTSTYYATVTSTSVLPTTILSTSMHTLTSTIPLTVTYTTSTTVTSTSVGTVTTSTPKTVATSTSKVTITNTATSTVTATATSTTQIVLPTLGAVHVYGTNDDSDQGYLMYNSGTHLFDTTTDESQAVQFVAVLDPSSGLYSLQYADGSGYSFIAEAGYQGSTFAAGTSAYSWAYPASPSKCGSAGTAAGPAAGAGSYNGYACEVYVFSPQGDSATLSDGSTLTLQDEWYNPGATSPGQYSWALNIDGLHGVADITTIDSRYGGFTPVSLRFPA